MLLSAKAIINWCNVNFYTLGNNWTINTGAPITLYFQVIDVSQAIISNSSGAYLFSGITPVGTTAGLRYLVGIGSSNQPYGITVTFPSVDATRVLTYTATQVDPADSSIWQVTLPATAIPAGGNVMFAVQQGNSVIRFTVQNLLAVLPTNPGCC